MESKQFEDMQRRGVVEFIDPVEERKENVRLWGWSTTAAVCVGLAAAIYYNSGITGICGGFIAFIVVFVMLSPDKPQDPFPT